MAQSLKIPLAHDETGSLVSVEHAISGGQYYCPSCGAGLILRRGTVKVAHFAHKPSDICNQETIIHKTAKLVVQQAVTDWKAGKRAAPVIQRACQVCHSLIAQPLPEKVETAQLEYRLSDGFIADVALLAGNTPVAAIEIFVTHAVDDTKATNISVPYIELDGYEVLASTTTWLPLNDNLEPVTCPECVKKGIEQEQKFAKYLDKTAQIAEKTGIELPSDYYRYAPHSCWRCKKDILVFTWPERLPYEPRQPSKQPIPMSIRSVFSGMADRQYWANLCPYCHATQGDWFLFEEPDGPFFGLDCGEDTDEAFNRDLVRLAQLADYNGNL